ncbi:signal peptidase I [Propionibacteriaceae bacterium G57]|uniref:signal peptidase I n=1 Tax=Aestuariimicrobium sp. G57 TaxID=3418485 RepID=UPI003DA72E87
MNQLTWLLAIAAIAIAGAVAGLALRRWVLFPARVESSSMRPTLDPGQRLLVRRVRGLHQLNRGDVVLVHSHELGRVVVKRAVGLPGDWVVFDKDGRAHRHQVGDGGVFLVGDNREQSSDSRRWGRPDVPVGAVLGRVVWPRVGRRQSAPRALASSGFSPACRRNVSNAPGTPS